MPVDTKDDEDTNLNPGQNNWDNTVSRNKGAASSLSDSEQSALNDISDNMDKTADPSQEDANIKKARDAESNPSSSKSSKSSDKGNDNRSRRAKIAGFAKNKGPMGIILAILIGGTGMLSAFSGPALAIVNLKETLMQDLNDSLPSMDKRAKHIMRSKIKNNRKGFCHGKVSFRCKYRSMSKHQLKKLKKAGIKIEPEKKGVLGRFRPKELVYTDSSGAEKRIRASEFKSAMINDPEFAAKARKAYNPRFAGFRDKAAGKVYTKFKVNLRERLKGTKEHMKKQMREAVKKGTKSFGGKKIIDTGETDEDGNKIYKTEDGKEVHPNKAQRAAIKANNGKAKLKNFIGKQHGVKSVMTKGMGVLAVTGGMTTLCHMFKGIQLASLAAKNLKYAQLLRYVMFIVKGADAIKTGDATPEMTSTLGEMITHIDLRDKTLNDNDDDSTLGKILSFNFTDKNPKIEPTDNPHKGENAFDSAGYKLAAYGDTTNLDMRESQYKLGGTPGGKKLSGAVDQIQDKVPLFSKDRCDFFTNPLVIGGSMVLGLLGAVFTGGTSLGLQAAKMAAIMAVSMVATTYVTAMINDMVKGTVADPDTAIGLDGGNAWFSGAAALSGSTASSHGLEPLSTPSQIQQSQRLAIKTKNQYAKVARYEARDTPFDIYNRYSFLGSIAFNLVPVASRASSMASLALYTPLTFLSTAISHLNPNVNAAVTSPPERFQKCDDPTYDKINLHTADQMCNIRFGNSPEELDADPVKVVDWMIAAGQIDTDTGEPNTDSEAIDKIQQVPVTSQEVSVVLHDEDDPNPPSVVARLDGSDKPKVYLAANDGSSPEKAIEDNDKPLKNVRTYAHWYRYCRYGPSDGRNVNFGDIDSDGDESIFTGLGKKAYQDDGRECLKVNNCAAGQNPNGEPHKKDDGKWYIDYDGTDAMKQRCRPPQYDIYSIFTLDKTIINGMDDEPKDDKSQSGLVTGEAKELAGKVANNDSITFSHPSTKQALEHFAETGEAQNVCGKPITINPMLSGAILTMAKDYEIKIENIGFKEDRHLSCAQYGNDPHSKGAAVDIAQVKEKSSGDTANFGAGYNNAKAAMALKFATKWMDILASKDPTRGRAGQLNCSGFNLRTHRHSSWKGPDGTLQFTDACNHLHLDVLAR